MTARTPNPRGRLSRRRLLIVSERDLRVTIAAYLAMPPLSVRNLFEALGEITVSSTQEPIGAVLIDAPIAARAGAAGLEALRKLDPALTLVLLNDDSSRSIPDALEFDHRINSSLTPSALREALSHTVAFADGRDEAPITTEPESSPQRPSAAGPPSHQATEPHQTPPAPEVEGDIRGDTDLIDRVLRSPHGVREAALSLLRRETGWRDALLASSATCEPPRRAVEVAWADHRFGWLTTAHADESDLAPWAAWLARWLALDRQFRDYRMMAYRDELTGAWNRRFFLRFFADVIQRARARRRPVTVMVFDIDNFKNYNDRFGHEAGDEVLVETVRLLNSVIRECDRVCRIGGDEFAVIFADLAEPREIGSSHPAHVEQIARRFQDQVCRMRFPKLGLDAPGTLSISAGLATYPWDGNDPIALLRHADRLSLESKRAGKNVITFGPGVHSVCDGPAPSDDDTEPA